VRVQHDRRGRDVRRRTSPGQVALLGHEADRGGQRGLPDAPYVDPVDLDRPARDVVQARDQVAGGGLTGSARPDQGDELAGVGSKARLTASGASTMSAAGVSAELDTLSE